MALTDQDLKKIHSMFVDAFEELWETNLEPNMAMKDDVRGIVREEVKMAMKDDVRGIVREEITNAKLATQAHVDTRFDALERSMVENMTEPSITRDRKLDEKTNVVAQKLGIKTVFTKEEVREVEHMTPFAVKPVTQ